MRTNYYPRHASLPLTPDDLPLEVKLAQDLDAANRATLMARQRVVELERELGAFKSAFAKAGEHAHERAEEADVLAARAEASERALAATCERLMEVDAAREVFAVELEAAGRSLMACSDMDPEAEDVHAYARNRASVAFAALDVARAALTTERPK